MERCYVECDCGLSEHRVVFHYYEKNNDDDAELYLTYYLDRQRTFKERILIALKYIFGYDTLQHQFNETSINKESAKNIITILSKFVAE